MDARVGPWVNGGGGCSVRANQGGGIVPLSHGTIVGLEKLLVMEFINSEP